MKLEAVQNPQFKDTLQKLLAQPLPGTTSWKLSKIVRQLESELKDYTEAREEMLKKFSDKNEAGEPIIENNAYKLSDESLKAFAQEHRELLQQDVEFTPLKSSELALDKIQLSANDFLVLEPLIAE